MKLFDSHAHYYDHWFTDPDKVDRAEALLPTLFSDEGGIDGIINVGTRLETSRLCIEQAAQYPSMYVAVGLHPEDCIVAENPLQELQQLRALLCDANERKKSKIVAVGEIGLDYYDRGIPLNKPLQMQAFCAQLELAQELDLPVIVHDRDAHGDCFETILRYPKVRGVFHSYSGSVEMARELYRRGWMISFSGVVTFKNAPRVQEVAASVPLEHLLIETDAPYLAPHPHRGKRNHSGLMIHTAQKIAELHGVSTEEIAAITRANAKSLFRIPQN